MAERDPFEVLELKAGASASDVKAARRRLAKRLHPDRGGDARRMQELNAAAAAALAALERGGTAPDARAPSPPPPTRDRPRGRQRRSAGRRSTAGERTRRPSGDAVVRRSPQWVVEDVPSFVVEALPNVTFELLVAVAPTVGTVLEDDPPYVLDVAMSKPEPCWCRLQLLPEGGASTINLYVGGTTGNPPPAVETVRDVWIAALNAAEWPSGGP